jgi:hypothetical protein
MPAVVEHLHYRVIDVRTIKELSRRWFARAYFQSPAKKGGEEWAASWSLGLDVAYNSNVWLLDGDDQDRLLADQPGDQISGRFDDMERIEDGIITPSLRVAAKGPSPFGRKLEAYAELEWRQYAVNSARSHLRARAGTDQRVGPDGRLAMDAMPVAGFAMTHSADPWVTDSAAAATALASGAKT